MSKKSLAAAYEREASESMFEDSVRISLLFVFVSIFYKDPFEHKVHLCISLELRNSHSPLLELQLLEGVAAVVVVEVAAAAEELVQGRLLKIFTEFRFMKV